MDRWVVGGWRADGWEGRLMGVSVSWWVAVERMSRWRAEWAVAAWVRRWRMEVGRSWGHQHKMNGVTCQ